MGRGKATNPPNSRALSIQPSLAPLADDFFDSIDQKRSSSGRACAPYQAATEPLQTPTSDSASPDLFPSSQEGGRCGSCRLHEAREALCGLGHRGAVEYVGASLVGVLHRASAQPRDHLLFAALRSMRRAILA